jgi:hypothetical protein
MATFRIFRMRPHARQNFRWAPHVTGLAILKPRDYEPGGEFEASNEYALWAELRGSDRGLDVGDAVESVGESGVTLKICKFVGFEAAKWAEAPVEVQAETGIPVAASEAESGARQATTN